MGPPVFGLGCAAARLADADGCTAGAETGVGTGVGTDVGVAEEVVQPVRAASAPSAITRRTISCMPASVHATYHGVGTAGSPGAWGVRFGVRSNTLVGETARARLSCGSSSGQLRRGALACGSASFARSRQPGATQVFGPGMVNLRLIQAGNWAEWSSTASAPYPQSRRVLAAHGVRTRPTVGPGYRAIDLLAKRDAPGFGRLIQSTEALVATCSGAELATTRPFLGHGRETIASHAEALAAPVLAQTAPAGLGGARGVRRPAICWARRLSA
jgi:hypothetical protein